MPRYGHISPAGSSQIDMAKLKPNDPLPTPTATYRDTLRFYADAVRVQRRYAIPGLLLPIGALFRTALMPFLASSVLAGLLHHDQNVMNTFIWLVVVAACGLGMEFIGINSLMVLQARAQAYLHNYVFSRLLSRSTSYYSNTISGKLTSDVIDYVSSFNALMNSVFISALTFSLMLIVGLILIAVNSWQLGLFLLISISGIVWWSVQDSLTRSVLRRERLKAQKALVSHLSDNVTNAVTVKTFARENSEAAKALLLSNHLADLRIRDWRRAVSNANVRNGTVIAAQLLMIFILIQLVKRDPSVLAAGIFAFTYTLTISTRIFELNTIARQIEEAFLQAQPMTQMLLEAPEIRDSPHAPALAVSEGMISFRNVTFAYHDGASNTGVFTDLSLTVQPGQKVGLVGPSGGGKSTLTRLLLRFDDVENGSIHIDEQDIAAVTQTSLRHALAYVPQEPMLFHRSIQENIAYGKPDASDDEIESAARLAHAHTFIDRLPNGYRTVVGERGVKLSGGQRQRIAIARAILKDAPILVLDEATSALDSESEVHIQKALWQLMQGRTAVVVAHRLSTIQKMDRILVLDEGAIVEDGTHHELIQRKDLYAKLWAHQSGGFLEE